MDRRFNTCLFCHRGVACLLCSRARQLLGWRCGGGTARKSGAGRRSAPRQSVQRCDTAA